MAGPIQFGGLASGLDTKAIIKALVQAEATPIVLLEKQKAGEKQKITQLGTLEGHLKALAKKAQDFASLSGLKATQVNASKEGVAAFNVTGSPASGNYTLDVQQLASADRWAFDGVASPTADLGSGSLSFEYAGTAYSVDFSSGGSLNALAAAITDETDGAVDAKVINTGTGSSPSWQLVLSGKDTGADNAITGIDAGSIAGLGGATQISAAANAVVVVDGLTIQRSTNTFADVIEGLEITLESAGQGPMQVSVGLDQDGMVDRLKEFIDGYNKVIEFINKQSSYSEESGQGGALFGDPALRTIASNLRQAIFSPEVVNGSSAYGSLGMLGIQLQSDGTLQMNESKVKEMLAADTDAFIDFFVDLDGFNNGGAEKGTAAYYQDTTDNRGFFMVLAKSIDKMLDSQTASNGQTYKGLLGARKESLETKVKSIDKNIEQLEMRLEAFEANLVLRFTALEKLLSGMQSQGAFLAQFG